MAVFYADGFDHYGTGATGLANMLKRNWSSSGSGPQSSVSRTGGNAWSGNDNTGSGMRFAFPAPKDVVGVAFAVRVDTLPSGEDSDILRMARISDTFNNQMCCLTIGTTGAIRLRNSAGTTLFSSAAGVLAAATWNHVEVKYTFAGTGGECEVRVNEVVVIDVSGVNLGAAATAEQCTFDDRAGASGFTTWYIEDLVVWDDLGGENDDFLGDVSVFTHMPNADTATADWTKSTGTVGYVILDDIPPDADYLEAATPGDRSDFEMPTFSVGNVSLVKAVQRFSLVSKASAGTATFQQGVVSNAVDGDGAVHSPTTTAGYYNDVFQVDPDTGLPWDVAGVEDMQIYIRKVA